MKIFTVFVLFLLATMTLGINPSHSRNVLRSSVHDQMAHYLGFASPIQMPESLIGLYNNLKFKRSPNWFALKLNQAGNSFVLDEGMQGTESDLESITDVLSQKLPRSEPRYVILNTDTIEQEDNHRKILYIVWVPTTTPITTKMSYLNQKNSIKFYFSGIQQEIQLSDRSELTADHLRELLN